jgi:hypothetical protein
MAAELDALNYPYIRVRGLDWLKQTLLIFPHVVRMTPSIRAPAEDPQISGFTKIESGRYPLLRAADLDSKHVHDAQSELIKGLRGRLEQDRKGFLAQYGRKAAEKSTTSLIGKNLTVWERRFSKRASFQIHAYKLMEELVEFLDEEKLAWTPKVKADGPDYLEMHPRLGEAVMATLAMACADNEGLQVVTEFPKLHGKLLGTPPEKILTACLDGIKPTGATSGQQIAEFLVYRRCNVDKLSAENIVALKDERAALADFRSKLETLAKSLPPTIQSQKVLDEKLEDTLNDMFKEWEKTQGNLGNTAQKFFGDGFSSEFKKVAEKFTDAILKPETAVATATAAGGTLIGGIPGHVLTSVGAGFAIGVVFRAVESWGKEREEAKTSPLRYLTRLQEQGVSFSLHGGSSIAVT